MGALRHKRFRRLLIGDAVSGFGGTAMFLALGVWAKDWRVMLGAPAVAALGCAPCSCCDRYPCRR